MPSTIPFIDARFFNDSDDHHEIEVRLLRHLRNVRLKRATQDLPPPHDAVESRDHASDPDIPGFIALNDKDQARIRRRVRRVLERRRATSGLEHLKSEDRKRLEILKDGAHLVSVNSEHHADEMAAKLHEDMPWMAEATEVVWRAMRRSVREGWPGLRIPPLLLDGPPGVGKSRYARCLGALLSTPTTVIEATGENASFAIVGSQRGWGGSHPGRLIGTILQGRIANPVIVVDELEKAGQATSMHGHAHGLAESLLPLLETTTAKGWSCPYYQVKVDLSWVIWVLTCNDFRLLPEPLLSRCPPIRLRHLTTSELIAFINREGTKRDLCESSIEAICKVLTDPALQRHQLSLRDAIRMLQRAADLEHQPVLH